MPLFCVILTGELCSYIIFIIQGHLQGQRFNRKLRTRKYDFYQIMLGPCVIPHFHGILTEKFIYIIILVTHCVLDRVRPCYVNFEHVQCSSTSSASMETISRPNQCLLRSHDVV